MELYDVAIVGAGPAGLTAALFLARCRRQIIVIDSGRPRNAAARAVNGYLGLPRVTPAELRDLGRQQAAALGVRFVDAEVTHADRCCEYRRAFRLSIATQPAITSRKLLLATGVRDELPPIEGLSELYGKSVHHCPYCDGWEHRDQRLMALGKGGKVVQLALQLRDWSPYVTACSNGSSLSSAETAALERNGIDYRQQKPVRLKTSTKGELSSIEFDDGRSLECDAVFFSGEQMKQSSLATELGCRCEADGTIGTDDKMRTGVEGLFLAGDAGGEVQLAIVAAAEGAIAAMAIHRELQIEDYGGP